MLTLTCEDCMDLMARYPDKYFDLAICDPPFGIGQDWKKRHKGNQYAKTSYKNDQIPKKEYFRELERVSKDRIIFGYNYFTEILGPTNYLIIWDKVSSNNNVFAYSQAEIAYTSIRRPIQVVSVQWDGYKMGRETHIKKIHPHQKPIDLYVKILQKYANPMERILDTHLGSGSSAIACHNMGFDLVACEIDPVYFADAEQRVNTHIAQGDLFPPRELKNEYSQPLFEDVP
ncbi:methyltransferase [Spirochaetia bacterium]|nr:methyltransferase [Spirochaetia bacterium]